MSALSWGRAALVSVCLQTCFPFAVGAALADDAADLGDGWMESPWFGPYYDAGSDWRYQDGWGWFYEVDGGDGAMWFYVPSESGWFWSGEESYPNVYRYSSSGWAWYWQDTIDPRLYYDYSAGWLASDGSDGAVWHAYYAAIEDASVAEYSEISRTLIEVCAGNDALPWDSPDTIRVVTWMPPTYVSSYVVGQQMTPSWEIWVSVTGEAQDFIVDCGLTGDALVLRMKQYMGLRPDRNYAYWVEFSVRPEDLFRPSPDPEPGDSQAMLDFPSSPESDVSEPYRAWFEASAASRYVLARWGYPWTRLGYTYDWGNPTSDVGASEFVIRPGATVTVTGVYANEEYFESAGPR